MFKRISPLIVGVLGLAGCGGSGDPATEINGFVNQLESVSAREATSAAALPSTGSVTYNGFIAVATDVETERGSVGTAIFNADFADAKITMTADKFSIYDGPPDGEFEDLEFVENTSGSLTMNDGAIGDIGSGIAGFTGTITGQVAGTNYDLDAEGIFAGDDLNALLGLAANADTGAVGAFVATK